MGLALAFVLVVHALIHLMGFAKASGVCAAAPTRDPDLSSDPVRSWNALHDLA